MRWVGYPAAKAEDFVALIGGQSNNREHGRTKHER